MLREAHTLDAVHGAPFNNADEFQTEARQYQSIVVKETNQRRSDYCPGSESGDSTDYTACTSCEESANSEAPKTRLEENGSSQSKSDKLTARDLS